MNQDQHIDFSNPNGEPCCSTCGCLELMVEKGCPKLENWVYKGVRMDFVGVDKFRRKEPPFVVPPPPEKK